MTTRQTLIAHLTRYQTPFSDEQFFIRNFVDLLQHQHAFERTHLPGHITGSAWIINQSRDKVLLTHHAKLNKWLQPGGHADGNENVTEVATREAQEETGLKSLTLLETGIFDIDVHAIPARNDMPGHDHYDIRLLFQASSDENFTVTEESHALAWVSIDEVQRISENNQSMIRMCDKTKKLKV